MSDTDYADDDCDYCGDDICNECGNCECDCECYFEEEDYDYGIFQSDDFKVGDRIRMTEESSEVKHIGALGTVVRIDDTDAPYPISVWLDVFKTATKVEIEAGLGLPVCAREIENA